MLNYQRVSCFYGPLLAKTLTIELFELLGKLETGTSPVDGKNLIEKRLKIFQGKAG